MKNFRVLFLSSLVMFLLSSSMPSTVFAGCPGNYTINASAGPGGTISPSGSISVDEGNNQSFFISANAGCSIQNVTVNGSSQGPISNYTFYGVSSDQSISAAFTCVSNVTLTVNIVGNGNVTANGTVFDGPGSAFTKIYSSGATANLSALKDPNDPNWAFVSWSEALTGNNTPTTLLMNASKTVTATFSPVRIDVSSSDFEVTLQEENGNYKLRLKSLAQDPNILEKMKNVNVSAVSTNVLASAKPLSPGIIKSDPTSIDIKWTQPASPAAANYKVQVHYSVTDPSECFADGIYDIEETFASNSPNLTTSGEERVYRLQGAIDPSMHYRCARVSASNTNGSSGFSEPAVAQRPEIVV